MTLCVPGPTAARLVRFARDVVAAMDERCVLAREPRRRGLPMWALPRPNAVGGFCLKSRWVTGGRSVAVDGQAAGHGWAGARPGRWRCRLRGLCPRPGSPRSWRRCWPGSSWALGPADRWLAGRMGYQHGADRRVVDRAVASRRSARGRTGRGAAAHVMASGLGLTKPSGRSGPPRSSSTTPEAAGGHSPDSPNSRSDRSLPFFLYRTYAVRC